jgi:hypothetical protein
MNWLGQTLQSPQIIAVILTALMAVIRHWLKPKALVIWGTSHGFTFIIPKEASPASGPFPVHTGTVFVQNVGKGVAEDIEVVFNYRPQHFQLWPSLNYDVAENPEHRFTIRIKNLGPREYTTVEMLSANVELPTTLRVRTPCGEAKSVMYAPMRLYSRWFNISMFVLAVLGVCALMYFGVLIARALV